MIPGKRYWCRLMESKLENEKRERLKLVLNMQPERIFWDQLGAIKELSQFPQMRVIFEYVEMTDKSMGEDEQSVAEQINFVAQDLGWTTWHRPLSGSDVPLIDAFGVRIFTEGKPSPNPL